MTASCCRRWVLLLTATVVASAAATGPLYATTAERVAAAEALNASPAIVALYGPILDTSSLGELSMTKMTVLYAVFVAFMAVVVVRRHTRVEEETGRAELVGATAVGVDAPVAAALAEAVLASVVLGVLVAAGNVAVRAARRRVGPLRRVVDRHRPGRRGDRRARGPGVEQRPHGRLRRLRRDRRRSTSCAPSVTRPPEWLSWLTPFGWGTQLSAWSEPRVWLLAGLPGARGRADRGRRLALRRRRDLGAGLLPDRAGPAAGLATAARRASPSSGASRAPRWPAGRSASA